MKRINREFVDTTELIQLIQVLVVFDRIPYGFHSQCGYRDVRAADSSRCAWKEQPAIRVEWFIVWRECLWIGLGIQTFFLIFVPPEDGLPPLDTLEIEVLAHDSPHAMEWHIVLGKQINNRSSGVGIGQRLTPEIEVSLLFPFAVVIYQLRAGYLVGDRVPNVYVVGP